MISKQHAIPCLIASTLSLSPHASDHQPRSPTTSLCSNWTSNGRLTLKTRVTTTDRDLHKTRWKTKKNNHGATSSCLLSTSHVCRYQWQLPMVPKHGLCVLTVTALIAKHGPLSCWLCLQTGDEFREHFIEHCSQKGIIFLL